MTSPATLPEPDAIVIGAGSGGLTVAVGLSEFGRRVRLIERDLVGGDCTNVGCIPSKALLHSTSEMNGRSGVDVLAHVRERRDHLREEETAEFAEMKNVDLQFGRARLLGGGQVEVVGAGGSVEVVEAKNVIVATGSRPRRIPVEGLPDDKYLTNEQLFEQVNPPKRLVIVGAGAIGVEMATAFVRLGTEVIVLEGAEQILPTVLPEAAEILHRSLSDAGVDLRPGLVAKQYDRATNVLEIGPLKGEASAQISEVDKVLVAVGRLPNTEGLGIERLGVDVDSGGRIRIDAKGRTSVDGLWATGDVSTEGATTHAANSWGRRIVKAIVFSVAPAGKPPEHPSVIYTSPEVATIGTQPVKVPSDVRRISFDLAKSDRAFTDEIDDGVIVVDIRRFSGKVLGATIVGPRAGELISIFSFAMNAGVPFHKWYGVVWPYPSYADALNHVVDEYMLEHLRSYHKDLPRWMWGRIRTRG